MIFTLALRMLKSREEAEEAAQDTFLKVFKSIRKFNGKAKFSTWTYKIAYNTCLDRIKVQKKRIVTSVDLDDIPEIQNESIGNVLENMEREEHRLTIKRCIELLPGDDGFILTLAYFEDHSVREIADIMNITESNVKVKLFRSRKRLTGILREQLEPEVINYYER